MDTGNMRNTALTLDEVRQLAPSVFAEHAAPGRSDRYRYISTARILEALLREGFEVSGAMQSRGRSPEGRVYARHSIKLRRAGAVTPRMVGDVVPEVTLLNSHDGTSAYALIAGMYRLVCANGLMIADGPCTSEVRVRHSGRDVPGEIIEGAYRVIDDSERAQAVAADWRGITLKREDQVVMAHGAWAARFGDERGKSGLAEAVRPEQLLVPRRSSDTGSDLWSTFNVLQENVIRGGQRARVVDNRNRVRRATVRAVRSVDRDTVLNRALWAMAEQMAIYKRAV